MAYEDTFNHDLAKKLCKSDDAEAVLDIELENVRKRALALNKARIKMAEGDKIVLEGLGEAFPILDMNDPNLTDSHNRMSRALIEVCSGLGIKD